MRNNQAQQKRQRQRVQFNTEQGFFGKKLDHEAPIIVCDCLAFIRNRGLYDVGVFRVTGSLDVVNKLKLEYDREFSTTVDKVGNTTSILNSAKPPPSVNDVASLLKAFFKELDGHLIPDECTKEMMAIIDQQLPKQDEIKQLSAAIKRIPTPNRECLGFLISFLREICTFKKFNQMGAENLATCFVLSIMGGSDALGQLAVLGRGAVVLKKLITQNVHIYMPSVHNVKQNTRYKDVKWSKDGEVTEVADANNQGESYPKSRKKEKRRTRLNREDEPAPAPEVQSNGSKKPPPPSKGKRGRSKHNGLRSATVAASDAFRAVPSQTAPPVPPRGNSKGQRKHRRKKDEDNYSNDDGQQAIRSKPSQGAYTFDPNNMGMPDF